MQMLNRRNATILWERSIDLDDLFTSQFFEALDSLGVDKHDYYENDRVENAVNQRELNLILETYGCLDHV